MKKLYSIIVLSCFCLLIQAQKPKQNCLEIELYQTDLSYTDNLTRNDYYPEFNKKLDYRIVHNADSSYLEGEVAIPFTLNHEEPSFNGGGPSEFCSWLGKRIFDLLGKRKKYSFRLTIDFVISSNGDVTNVRIDPYHSDDEWTSLDENILTFIKESPKWAPEHHYWKRYCTPFRLRISSNSFVKGMGMVLIRQYSDWYFNFLNNQLWLDSPEKARKDVIPDYQIASDKDIHEMAHPEDESVNLNQWIKNNIQDATEISGFADGESEIELIISANGWVSKVTVIESYDPLLGEYLADQLLQSCPRWVPAKINGTSVPSKVRITYSWRF